ncbi:hypothetical protein SLS60_011060 [Paraconiothyrium brasiliense]|uniref:Heme haloperoxidase family profile domain-containing protein n=1 Tax=Paraconiothyrium brasiliense TaxID=300254 RepID=A0ABR3QKG1_9PLEO
MDREMIVGSLSKWYNIAEEVSGNLFARALLQTGRPNATTFDMTDLRLHHNASVMAIEGDASFSRADYYWGDDYSLNHTVWKQTRSFWKGKTIDVQEFGNAARARYLTSKATNPTFYFPAAENIGVAMAFMTNVLGDAEAGTVPTAFVDEWIATVKERLPAHLGWHTSGRVTTTPTVKALADKIFAASGLEAGGDGESKRSILMHAGIEI